MPSRLTLALVAALAIASGLALWGWSEAGQYYRVAQERTRELEAAQARLVGIQKQVREVEAQAAAARADLQEVLDAAPDWSRTAVPVGVADGLCKHIKCR